MATQVQPKPVQDALAARFKAVRALSRDIAAPLSDADATIQPHADASPAKWHLGHTTWFFETFVLRDLLPGYRRFDERWAYLFNSYYEGEGDRQPRPKRGMLSRPPLSEVLAYRDHVEEAVLDQWQQFPASARELIELGINHEQQHQELMLMDMLAAMAENPLVPAVWPAARDAESPPAKPMAFFPQPGGIVDMGADGSAFAFDCEGPRHQVLLRPYEIADRLVTNADWLQFIQDRGYARPELWLSEGWSWLGANRIEAPLYWRRHPDGWMRFGLDGLRPVDVAEPVCHLSYFEADAFARWAGARLPTEAEWEAAAAGCDPGGGNQLDNAGPARPTPVTGPVDAAQHRLRQMFGDVWQWTMSAFLPYPGFKPAAGTVGEYNGKFMCGQFVLRGASCATPRGHSRASYRNFFYPHQRWMFSGLRLARDL